MRFLIGTAWKTLAVFVCLFAVEACDGADDANAALFANRAVQRDLNLSKEQQNKVDKLVAEIEDQTAWQIARGDGGDRERYEQQLDKVLEQQGQRFMALLNNEQQVRFWQIGMQAHGRERAFSNNRVQRLLKLSAKQIADIDQIVRQTGNDIRKLADDKTLDVATLKERFELAKQECLASELKVLSAEQRKEFDELFGKPFDLELLERLDGTKPRALTVIFPSRGRSGHFLLGSAQLQAEQGLSADQKNQIAEIMKQADSELTAIRLKVLKQSEKDFRELSMEEKRKAVKVILDGTAPIHDAASKKVAKVLTPEQAAKFDERVMQVFGPRAIEADSIAARLQLSAEQKALFAKLTADFDFVTAPWIVVRRTEDLNKQYDAELKKLDAAINEMLTAEQRQTLTNAAK